MYISDIIFFVLVFMWCERGSSACYQFYYFEMKILFKQKPFCSICSHACHSNTKWKCMETRCKQIEHLYVFNSVFNVYIESALAFE